MNCKKLPKDCNTPQLQVAEKKTDPALQQRHVLFTETRALWRKNTDAENIVVTIVVGANINKSQFRLTHTYGNGGVICLHRCQLSHTPPLVCKVQKPKVVPCQHYCYKVLGHLVLELWYHTSKHVAVLCTSIPRSTTTEAAVLIWQSLSVSWWCCK